MNKPKAIRMDITDPTKNKNDKYLITVKVTNTSKTPVAKLECYGSYDKTTVDAILNLMGWGSSDEKQRSKSLGKGIQRND